AYIAQDPEAKVACETLVTTDRVVVAGEIKAHLKTPVDVDALVRKAISEIGYTHADIGFDAKTCKIENILHEQSADIRQGVEREDELGAGDQGRMFGYACRETAELMPAPIALAHRLTRELSRLRKSGEQAWIRPDGKAQVTLEYADGKPVGIHTLVLSTQHSPDISQGKLSELIKSELFAKVLPKEWMAKSPRMFINPTGRFVIGGPHGDCGLTGRKIIVDTYGGMAPHGGGAFSGKDPSKVDRSAAYLARYIAKNVVAAGLADRFQVQLAYAIGVPEPVSFHLEDFGTSKVDLTKLEKVLREIFPARPGHFINTMNLKRPIYRKTTAYGHFGREDADFTWESTDKAALLRKEFGA
ncbi:MAG: methionine adenosyltransferase, partial [Bdellovibrionota bacterium]